MPAIEKRNWQQVDESQINRNQGHEQDEVQPAQAGLLA